jgi:hypothetical protein
MTLFAVPLLARNGGHDGRSLLIKTFFIRLYTVVVLKAALYAVRNQLNDVVQQTNTLFDILAAASCFPFVLPTAMIAYWCRHALIGSYFAGQHVRRSAGDGNDL